MFKRFWDRLRRDRAVHKATVNIDFFPDDVVTPAIFWHQSEEREGDTVTLMLFMYARILYELAELNEVRVARELMDFVGQVCGRILSPDGPPGRLRLPLGQLRLATAPSAPAERSYRAEFYRQPDGSYRLDFQGSVGKEGFFLPGGFLALMQSCLDNLPDEPLGRMVRGMIRLHAFYRYRRDFWESSALTAGPAFALGTEEIRPEEAGAETAEPAPTEN